MNISSIDSTAVISKNIWRTVASKEGRTRGLICFESFKEMAAHINEARWKSAYGHCFPLFDSTGGLPSPRIRLCPKNESLKKCSSSFDAEIWPSSFEAIKLCHTYLLFTTENELRSKYICDFDTLIFASTE
jgi:hypothetical protein